MRPSSLRRAWLLLPRSARDERASTGCAHPCEVNLMTVPQDPYLQGRPFRPETPRDPNDDTVLDESERGKDEARGEYVDTLSHTPARPLTDDEEEAAEQ